MPRKSSAHTTHRRNELRVIFEPPRRLVHGGIVKLRRETLKKQLLSQKFVMDILEQFQQLRNTDQMMYACIVRMESEITDLQHRIAEREMEDVQKQESFVQGEVQKSNNWMKARTKTELQSVVLVCMLRSLCVKLWNPSAMGAKRVLRVILSTTLTTRHRRAYRLAQAFV